MSSGDIEEITVENEDYRRVIHTGKHAQLVVMSLKPGEDIGAEIHADTDQFIRIEKGYAKAIIDEIEYKLRKDDYVFVNAGSRHNIINLSSTRDLKLYTIYSSHEHDTNCVQKNKSTPEC